MMLIAGWMLIIFFSITGEGGAVSVPMLTEGHCELAALQVRNNFDQGRAFTFCVATGAP